MRRNNVNSIVGGVTAGLKAGAETQTIRYQHCKIVFTNDIFISSLLCMSGKHKRNSKRVFFSVKHIRNLEITY